MPSQAEIRNGIKLFLERLPNDRESHQAILSSLDNLKKAYDTSSISPIAQNFNLFNAIGSVMNTAHNISSLAKNGLTATWLYNNIKNPNFIAGLAENGLFEILAENPELKEKTVRLIDSFIKYSTHKKQQEIIEIDELLRQCDIQRQNSLFLSEFEEELSYSRDKPALQKEIDSLKQSMNELIPTNPEELERYKAEVQAARDKLTKEIGPLAATMTYYKDLARDLNDSKLLTATLSSREYTYKVGGNLKSSELGVIVKDDKLYLCSNHGAQLLEIDRTEIGEDQYKELRSIAKQKLALNEANIAALKQYTEMHDFPGILQNVYKKLDAFIKDGSEPNKKAMVMSCVELLTQEHVAPTLTPLANSELVADIFRLPTITPEVRLYEPLVAHLANKEREFQNLFGAMTTQAAELTEVMDKVMDFVALPADLSPENPELIKRRKDMTMACVKLLAHPDIARKVNPLASQELVADIFALPNVANNPNVKSYEPLVSQLASRPEEFQKLFSTITSQGTEFTKSIDNIMDFVYPPEGANPDRLAENMQISLIELAKPNLVTALIPLIDSALLEEVFKLPALKALEPASIALANEIQEIAQNEETKKAVIDELAKEKGLHHDLIRQIETAPTTKSSKQISTKEPSEVTKKIVGTIRALAAKSDDLNKAVRDNSEQLKPMLQTLINSPHGKVLKDFHLSAQEVTDFLPKICTKKGLDAVASYVEKPSTIRLINIFVQTNTLGFAVTHYVKSLISKPKELEVVGTQTEKLAEARRRAASLELQREKQ